MNRFFLFSLLALALAACQTPETEAVEPTVTPAMNVAYSAADSAAVAAISTAWANAARAGDPAAIAALYADDAVIHPANEPSIRGREAIDDYFAATHSEPVDNSITTVNVTVSEAGDLAYELGTSANPPGKYLTVYRRTPDGWHIVADAWSDNAPPTPAN